MSNRESISLHPAYVIHRKPFRDTSLLLEVFSAEYGRFGLVARGVRRGKRSLASTLQPFQPLLLSWSSRGELGTLTGAEPAGQGVYAVGEALVSGFYINELLMRLVPRFLGYPELFQRYSETVQALATPVEQLSWSLRLFERDLLETIGYGLLLDKEAGSSSPVQTQQHYCYYLEQGPQLREGNDCEAGIPLSGAALLALESGNQPQLDIQRDCKRLMRAVLALYLGNRPLQSREMFRVKRSTNQNNQIDQGE